MRPHVIILGIYSLNSAETTLNENLRLCQFLKGKCFRLLQILSTSPSAGLLKILSNIDLNETYSIELNIL